MENVFQVVLYGIIALFVLGVIYTLGVTIVGGYVMPLALELNPNSTISITGESYTNIASNLWDGLRWGFYILIASILVYVGVKLFYQKEETSQYYG